MEKSYEILSHDDSTKKFLVKHKGYTIEILYPGDIDLFSEITENHMDIYLSGILLSYKDQPEYVEPNTQEAEQRQEF